METKILSNVPVASALLDTEYILVTMADGSVGRIKKSDLMPIVSHNNNGLMPYRIFKFINMQGWTDSSSYFKIGSIDIYAGRVYMDIKQSTLGNPIKQATIAAYGDNGKIHASTLLTNNISPFFKLYVKYNFGYADLIIKFNAQGDFIKSEQWNNNPNWDGDITEVVFDNSFQEI